MRTILIGVVALGLALEMLTADDATTKGEIALGGVAVAVIMLMSTEE